MENKEEFKAHLAGNILSSNSKKAYTFSKDNFFGEKDDEKIVYSLSEGLFLSKYKGMKIYSGKKVLGSNEIISKFVKLDKNFQRKYKIYEELRKKGFILKSGIKYGADFSVYEKGKKPGRDHSSWLISSLSSSEKVNWREFILKNRVANSTKKNIILAIEDPERDILYYEVKWKKL